MSLIDETLRLLGCRGEPEKRLLNDIESVMHELNGAARFKYVSEIFPANIADGRLIAGGLTLESEALSKHLFGCKEVILFAATLGAAVDRLMRRMSATSIEFAAILQAAASALIEERCDAAQYELIRERPGINLTPRFSPGYGDLSLEYQSAILNMLDAGKRIGLSVTNSMMLSPAKSVTAIIGIGAQPCVARHDCADCDMKDCFARRYNP